MEDQSHSYASKHPLKEEYLPPFGGTASEHKRQKLKKTAAGEAGSKVSSTDQWSRDDSHKESGEDLKRSDPCDFRVRIISQKVSFIVRLENTECL